MRGDDFLDKMELVDPAFVEAADRTPSAHKRSAMRWGVLAACICFVIATTTALAVSSLRIKVIDFFTSHTESDPDYSESGFTLSIDIEKIPVEALKGKIREVPAYIEEQFDSYEPYSNWYPGHWQKKFESRDAAYDYIRFDGLKKLHWDIAEGQTTLNVSGKSNGAILSVGVATYDTVGDIGLQFFSDIFTENYTDEITTGSVTTEYVEFTESLYTTKNNKVFHILEGTALQSGYLQMDAYLVENGVLYQLHISHLDKDTQKAKELLHQWADLF